jgi:hypothetical protein
MPEQQQQQQWSASKQELKLKPASAAVIQPIPDYKLAPKSTPEKLNFFAQRTLPPPQPALLLLFFLVLLFLGCRALTVR